MQTGDTLCEKVEIPAVVSKRGVDGNQKGGLSPAGARELELFYHKERIIIEEFR
jgi:hypothetical protein